MSETTTIRETIIGCIRQLDPRHADTAIADSMSLEDLNIDSLRLIELGVLVEDSFGGKVRFDPWLEAERARPGDGRAFLLQSLVDYVAAETAR